MKFYKVARNRSFEFTVNCPITKKETKFLGSRNGFTDVKDIPEETFNWLMASTTTFKDGELALVEEDGLVELKKATYEEEFESIKANTHTRDEIVKILNGNTNAMKKQLESITIPEEKRFVVEIAKDIKLDSVAKVDFIKAWSGVDVNEQE